MSARDVRVRRGKRKGEVRRPFLSGLYALPTLHRELPTGYRSERDGLFLVDIDGTLYESNWKSTLSYIDSIQSDIESGDSQSAERVAEFWREEMAGLADDERAELTTRLLDYFDSLPNGAQVAELAGLHAAWQTHERTGVYTDPTYNSQSSYLQQNEIMAAYERGEQGDAELLAALYSKRLAFDASLRVWHVWSGQHWTADYLGQVGNLIANQVAAQYLFSAAEKRRANGNERAAEQVDALWKRGQALRYAVKIKRVLERAQSLDGIAVSDATWDRNPWLMAVANGTLDLRTGALFNGRPDDYLRCAAPAEWEGIAASAPRWESFLREIFDHDEETISFLQRLFGYGITGLNTEHIFVILCGEGRNGKDTLLESIAHTLGPLASMVSSEILIDTPRTGGGPTPHLYALRHLRLAWVSETSEGARLNTSQVKLLTGGSQIVTRPMYGRPVTFHPQYLLMLLTNHRPHANADDYALWKRMLVVEFNQAFVDEPRLAHEHQREPGLLNILKGEASGILAWLVRGCLEWQRVGLCPPQAVKMATENYREGEDTLAQYDNERLVKRAGLSVAAQDVYLDYSRWSTEHGLKPMTGTAFGRRMKKIYQSVRGERGVSYIGIGLMM